MTSLLLLAVLFGSVILVVLMIYLGDRVKRLEIMSLHDSSEPAEVVKPKNDNGFLGLSGKKLWDAMSGKVPEGFVEADVVALKRVFEVVLKNHIETLFKLGKRDATSGNSPETPKNPLEISTLRHSIESWIPAQHVSTIYKAGYESIGADEVSVSRLRANLDDAADTLFSRTALAIKQPFSERLFAAAVALPATGSLIELDEESLNVDDSDNASQLPD
ncbi:hypothetical protein NYF23_00710 [SAR92 clade bacterium H455]|uniref:Uncharacterized protein n=1 Tax=SAR92 clade bacterium H455 TaxID=2974818 RepID=A0ABY5TMR5_9GAMM|nr:hypothetical protein NYF23_00710 [SAR92 clade bacterium H455]